MTTTAPHWLATLDPASHCFREDNCAAHSAHGGPGCCCCGADAAEHTGCDCEEATVSRADAEQVRDALAAWAPAYPAPVLLADFDGRPWTILWEEGPEDWVYRLDGVTWPAGTFIEPVNTVLAGIWPA